MKIPGASTADRLTIPDDFSRERFERREELETRTEKLTCPFCKRERSVKIVKAVRGEFFSESHGTSREYLESSVGCECGARFVLWKSDLPKDYTTVRLTPEILAAKLRVEIEKVKFKGKKSGKMYHWKQTRMTIPKAFQTVRPGRYTIFHEGDDIILRPVKAAS
jgi:hypothetical protein